MKLTLSIPTMLFAALISLFASLAVAQERPIRVAVYDDKGVGKGSAKLIYKRIQDNPEFVYRVVNGEDIRNDVLNGFDIVVLPGGSGRGEAKSMGEDGVEKVKQFVQSGRGYMGICAGAYFPIQQHFVNIERRSTIWVRGGAKLDIELTELGRKVFGEEFSGLLKCSYHNGPVVNINVDPNGTKVDVLAWFRSETAVGDSTPGIQVNSPAMVFTTYGKGPIITISPHPEGTKELHSFVPSALKYIYKNIPDDVKAENAKVEITSKSREKTDEEEEKEKDENRQ